MQSSTITKFDKCIPDCLCWSGNSESINHFIAILYFFGNLNCTKIHHDQQFGWIEARTWTIECSCKWILFCGFMNFIQNWNYNFQCFRNELVERQSFSTFFCGNGNLSKHNLKMKFDAQNLNSTNKIFLELKKKFHINKMVFAISSMHRNYGMSKRSSVSYVTMRNWLTRCKL